MAWRAATTASWPLLVPLVASTCASTRRVGKCSADPPRYAPLLRLVNAAAIFTDPLADPLKGDVELLLGPSSVLEVSRSPAERSVISGPVVSTLDVSGLWVVPGFVDSHVHAAGGGGEAGFRSRTPEAELSELVEAGLTTVVGIRGTDGVTRSAEGLIAKMKSLGQDGLTALAWTGSYTLPASTATGSVARDVVLISEVIGVGEVAVSDHRASHTRDELRRVAGEARTAGLLAGKAGVLYCHMGDAPSGLEPLWDVVNTTATPIANIIPTHMSRNAALVKEGKRWLQAGGYVDFTSDAKLTPAAVAQYLKEGLPMDRVLCSTDAFGSFPTFDDEGRLVSYAVTSPNESLKLLQRLVKDDDVPMKIALPLFTANPARALGLPQKGCISPGCDADVLVLDPSDMSIRYVIAGGQVLKTPEWTRRGMFERCSQQCTQLAKAEKVLGEAEPKQKQRLRQA